MEQFLISVDQVFNTMVWAKGEGFGWADETISARMFRLSDRKNWRVAMTIVNGIFFWQDDHCYEAYISELTRKHLPKHYRNS